jgi:hypothetical protein
MSWLVRRLPSPAMVVALIALFVALGGSAYALVITGKQIKNGSITGKDVKRNSLTGRQIRESRLGPVPRAAVANGLSPSGLAKATATGYAALREHSPGFQSGSTTILTLNLPAGGNYLVFAKTNVVNEGGLETGVTCALDVGADHDDASARVGPAHSSGQVESLALTVPHVDAAAAQARLSCSDPSAVPGDPLRRASAARIVAVRLGGFDRP